MVVKFCVAAMPADKTIFSFIKNSTDYDRVCRSMRTKLRDTERIELELAGVDVDGLLASVKRIIDERGFRGWQHKDGESKIYGGFSLTYNPDHQDKLDPHTSSIGTPKNLPSEFFWNSTERHAELKHSYFDTYGFRRRTPASQQGMLGEFLDTFRRPLIRSRVGIIQGESVDAKSPWYQQHAGWHRDEPVFENLRINIPLQSDENFVFQMEKAAPYHLKVGAAYSWDTNRPHRVFAIGPTKAMRIHLVLGFSPWFDYCESNDAWSPNEFFGRVHPFDMLASGHFSEHLKLRQQRRV